MRAERRVFNSAHMEENRISVGRIIDRKIMCQVEFYAQIEKELRGVSASGQEGTFNDLANLTVEGLVWRMIITEFSLRQEGIGKEIMSNVFRCQELFCMCVITEQMYG
jgi:hypothetical protein